MVYISSTTLEWLDQNNMRFSTMLNLERQNILNQKLRAIKAADPEYDRWSDDPADYFDYWNDHLLLQHTYNRGWINYRELRNGYHAKLEIRDADLPETVCSAIRGKPRPVRQIVDLPSASIASKAGGMVIRAVNKPNGTLELLVRIEWQNPTVVDALERM